MNNRQASIADTKVDVKEHIPLLFLHISRHTFFYSFDILTPTPSIISHVK